MITQKKNKQNKFCLNLVLRLAYIYNMQKRVINKFNIRIVIGIASTVVRKNVFGGLFYYTGYTFNNCQNSIVT